MKGCLLIASFFIELGWLHTGYGKIAGAPKPVLINKGVVRVLSGGMSTSINLLSGATGPIDTTTLVLVTPPNHGSIVFEKDASGKKTGRITFQANRVFSGTDSLAYRVCGFSKPLQCDSQKLIIQIYPNANNDRTSTHTNHPMIPFNLLANDNGLLDTGSLAINNTTDHGKTTLKIDPVTGKTNGFIDYLGNANYSGKDTLFYQVCDQSKPSACTYASCVITIYPKVVGGTVFAISGASSPPIDVLAADTGSLNKSLLYVDGYPKHGFTRIDPATGGIS